MAKLHLYKIKSSKLSSLPIVEGQFIVTTDDKRIYLDDIEGQRVALYNDEIDKLAYIANNATKVETSTKNGYIKIDGVEVQVYKAPASVNTTYTLSKDGNTIVLTGSDGNTTSVTDNNTTYDTMQGSSTTVDGKTGLVPAPAKGNNNRYLSANGTWSVPTNTTYNDATQTTHGLMSTTDKIKLDGIQEGAQVNTVTGVKGSSETSYRTGDINITKENVGLSNVENKSSATIRGELTKSNVTTALGYTPPENDTNTTYGLSLSNNTLSLVEGGTSKQVTISTKDTTYTLSQDETNGHIIKITSSDGDEQSVTIPDNNTTYGLKLEGHKVTLVPGGTTTNVTIPDNNTTYTLTQDATDGHKITLTPSTGTATTITIPDNNTTYGSATQSAPGLMTAADKKKLDGIEAGANKTTDTNTTYTLTQDSTDGHKITLTPSTGNATTITIPDNNTTYSAGTGISFSGTTINNSGVRSISAGTTNGTISVNTNGTSANVAVKGLGSLAYKSSLGASDVGAIPTTQKGVANGVASLDENGLVPSAQLPSFVDDVIEGYYSGGKFYKESAHTTEITGESGKIYVDLATNKTYRWSGTAFAVISDTLALGTTSSTAFRGDYGNTAYTHASAKGSAFTSGLYKITTNAQGHVTAATAVEKADITALGIPSTNTTYSVATTSANGLMSSTDKTKLDGIATGANNYSHPTTAGNKHIPAGGSSGQILRWSANGTAVWGNDNNTTYSAFKGATSTVDGGAGLVPAPTKGNESKYLRADGTWQTPPDTKALGSMTGTLAVGHGGTGATDATTARTNLGIGTIGTKNSLTYSDVGLAGAITNITRSGTTFTATKADGSTFTFTQQDNNTTYSNMKGATAGAAGSAGLVPAPAAGKQTSFLRGDGTWVVPNNTWTKVSTTADGYISKLSGSTTQWLNGNGAWSTPTAANVGALASTTTYAKSSSVGGDALKAVQLTTERKIDGVNFNGTADISHYGTCSTTAATAGKVVACSNYTLVTGSRIIVKFTVTNTAAVANLTMNVNGTGAKPIKYRNGNLPSTSILSANRVYEFVYDGTNYQLLGDLDTNTNTTYGAGTGLSLSGTTFSLATSGVTAGTKGPTANVTGSNGATIKVPKVTVDTYGRVTALEEYTFKAQNTNTNYYPTAFAWTNGTTSGPTGSLTGSGMSAVSVGAIPTATDTASGVVTTGAQTFAGVKTFKVAPKLTTNTITSSGGYTVTLPNATATLATTSTTQALTNKTYNGYTLGAACAKGVDTSMSKTSTSTNVPTTKAVADLVSALSGCTTQATSLTCTLPDNL